MKSYLHTIPTVVLNRLMKLDRARRFHIFNLVETLKHPDDNVRGFRKGKMLCKGPSLADGNDTKSLWKLTTKTLPRTASKRHKLPTRLSSLPTLRLKLLHIIAPDISSVLHRVLGNQDM